MGALASRMSDFFKKSRTERFFPTDSIFTLIWTTVLNIWSVEELANNLSLALLGDIFLNKYRDKKFNLEETPNINIISHSLRSFKVFWIKIKNHYFKLSLCLRCVYVI